MVSAVAVAADEPDIVVDAPPAYNPAAAPPFASTLDAPAASSAPQGTTTTTTYIIPPTAPAPQTSSTPARPSRFGT